GVLSLNFNCLFLNSIRSLKYISNRRLNPFGIVSINLVILERRFWSSLKVRRSSFNKKLNKLDLTVLTFLFFSRIFNNQFSVISDGLIISFSAICKFFKTLPLCLLIVSTLISISFKYRTYLLNNFALHVFSKLVFKNSAVCILSTRALE